MEFWDELSLGLSKEASSLDEHLGAPVSESVRALTDSFRGAVAGVAGERVAFRGTLSSLLSYPNPPSDKEEGTVVTVRSASGDTTVSGDFVFVKWDSGSFLPVHRAHLKSSGATRSTFRKRFSSVGDLSDFMKTSGNDLVHKATKDLWAMRKEGDEFVIERLFDETGSPLKV